MTTVSIDHIVLDDNGVARVAGTRSKVTQIAHDVRNGMSPEQVVEAYPHLSLSQVHAALSYYYDHRKELDAEAEEGSRIAEAIKGQSAPAPGKAELRKRLRVEPGVSGDAS